MAWRIMVQCPRCGQQFFTARSRPNVHCSQKCFWGPPEERFWRQVDKTPGHGPNGDCWIWTGLSNRRGYGKMSIDNKTVQTHIFSYRIHKGEVPKGAFVCHSCDIPACQNPNHLWLGDAKANNDDKIRKGRANCQTGQSHHNSKLTDADVLKIREDNRMQKIIAKEYGVAKSQISLIKSGKIWTHLLAKND